MGLAAVLALLQSAQCAKLYIDFLGVATDAEDGVEHSDPKNHAILKVDFSSNIGPYCGVRIKMELNWAVSHRVRRRRADPPT